MKYIKILENFGVTITDEEREEKFCNNILNVLMAYDNEKIPGEIVITVCQSLGISMSDIGLQPRHSINAGSFLRDILFPGNHNRYRRPVEIKEFMTRLSILLREEFFTKNETLKSWVQGALEEWCLPYVLCEELIVPKGVKEFDEALVCDIAVWLQNYPSTHRSYIQVLQQYFDNGDPRDIADNLRKSFEMFLQEFLGNTKNLDNNIKEIGSFLKSNDVNEEVRNMFTTLSTYYKKLNDKTAKHHDKTDKRDVEFLLYQTGVFLRYLLIVAGSNEEEEN